jgi:predicted patatin/cPLA2 family phospholipase
LNFNEISDVFRENKKTIIPNKSIKMIKDTALVLEGGGFRGIFTAGILEVFMENNLYFESVYGVSAGATYAASYISRQPGRNLEVNELINDKRYLGFKNLLRERSLFSWDFILEEIPQKIIPFDYETLKNSDSQFYVGASNCETGKAEFFLLYKADKQDFKTIFTASCSLPLIAPVVRYRNKQFLDGGLADSIPFKQALKNGQSRALVILTQPRDYQKEPLKYKYLFKWFYRKHPKVYEMLCRRADKYNDALRQLKQLEKEGIVYVIRPDKPIEIKRIENNPVKTRKVFEDGVNAGKKNMTSINRWLNSAGNDYP